MPKQLTLEELTSPQIQQFRESFVDPTEKMRTLLKEAPQEIEFEPGRMKSLRGALRAGKYGALIGGGLGALRAAMMPRGQRSYLRDTLAGMLLGGVGAGGTAYLAGTDPFTRGGPAARGFERGKAVALARMLDPSASPTAIARESISAGLGEILSGKHVFGPEEQRALLQQFVKARVPTSSGWRQRINLAERAIQDLQANPAAALPALVTLQKVAPDPEMRAYASEAVASIRGGRAVTPEGRNALAAYARTMASKVEDYRRATHTIDALNVMKELYAAGQLSPTDVAKNVGLITGRFGPSTARAESTRQLIQSALSPKYTVKRHPKSPYTQLAVTQPDIAKLVSRAMQ